MTYLLLAYHEEKTWDALSKCERDAVLGECRSYDEALRKSGHVIAMEGLQPVRNTTTVRVRNGKLLTTDGPFAETKDQLGGILPRQRRGPERGHPGGLEHCGRAPGRAFGMGCRGATDRRVRVE